MGAIFDGLFNEIERYRAGVADDYLEALRRSTSPLNNFWGLNFPKNGAPEADFNLNSSSQNLKVPEVNFAPVASDVRLISEGVQEFQQALDTITLPSITIDFDSTTDLTSYGDLQAVIKIDPTRKKPAH